MSVSSDFVVSSGMMRHSLANEMMSSKHMWRRAWSRQQHTKSGMASKQRVSNNERSKTQTAPSELALSLSHPMLLVVPKYALQLRLVSIQ